MQEIKKQSIVIASILKPVDDTRMYEKMGRSLIQTGNYDLHIIGYGKSFDLKEIQAYPLGCFARISMGRLLVPLKVLRLLLKIKPNVLVINTHELLMITLIYKLIFRCRVIYDLTENYYLNIIHTKAFPPFIKYLVAFWVRMKEWITSPVITHYLLAESTYQHELSFIGNKFTVIENKSILPEHFKRTTDPGKIRLLFSGTIDSSTGIWEAISLAKILHELDSRVELQIIGYCAMESLRMEILKEISSVQFISCTGLNQLVNHSLIFDEIGKADAGIVYYPASVHNKNRIPTKIYEYLACQLPVLFDGSAAWKEIIVMNKAGMELDFRNPNLQQILNQLNSRDFYPKPVDNALWNDEESKFLRAIQH